VNVCVCVCMCAHLWDILCFIVKCVFFFHTHHHLVHIHTYTHIRTLPQVDSESLMVLQSWKNEAGLHKYYNSEAFRAASAQFRDAQVLIRPPDFREYVVTD
jgi:heme-degrading monooxygenase HmoA